MLHQWYARLTSARAEAHSREWGTQRNSVSTRTHDCWPHSSSLAYLFYVFHSLASHASQAHSDITRRRTDKQIAATNRAVSGMSVRASTALRCSLSRRELAAKLVLFASYRCSQRSEVTAWSLPFDTHGCESVSRSLVSLLRGCAMCLIRDVVAFFSFFQFMLLLLLLPSIRFISPSAALPLCCQCTSLRARRHRVAALLRAALTRAVLSRWTRVNTVAAHVQRLLSAVCLLSSSFLSFALSPPL